MKKADLSIFPYIFTLIEESFPSTERRTYEGQKALLSKSNYQLLFQSEKTKIKSIMAIWEFSSFVYIEHFAVSKLQRGKGIGSAFMKDFLKTVNKLVILEVEKPCDLMTQKRIQFYERIGFHLNTYAYDQPPLQEKHPSIPLFIMSYPSFLTKQQFEAVKYQLYQEVYGQKDDRKNVIN